MPTAGVNPLQKIALIGLECPAEDKVDGLTTLASILCPGHLFSAGATMPWLSHANDAAEGSEDKTTIAL